MKFGRTLYIFVKYANAKINKFKKKDELLCKSVYEELVLSHAYTLP